MGSFRAVHAEAVAHLRAPLPARNASAGRVARDRFTGGDIITDGFQWAATVKTRGAVIALL